MKRTHAPMRPVERLYWRALTSDKPIKLYPGQELLVRFLEERHLVEFGYCYPFLTGGYPTIIPLPARKRT